MMTSPLIARAMILIVVLCGVPHLVVGQEPTEKGSPAAAQESQPSSETPAAEATSDVNPADETAGQVPPETAAVEKARELADSAGKKIDDVAGRIDQNETAQDAAAGILQPIYVLAESLAFPTFYWLAFALMSAGVVGFAFQLVFGKLVVLAKGSINIREILSDTIGFVISAVGLVLATQAATENSTFTQSAAAVLSSSLLGVVLGLFLYRWGQAQEVSAVIGQRAGKKR